MEYLAAGDHGTLAERSRDLVAVARGDAAPDTLVRDGTLVNVHTAELREHTDLLISDGRVARVVDTGTADDQLGDGTTVVDADGAYLAPGFLDGHVHIESTMVTATGFARGVVPRGTTGVFADPHEIGNVLGLDGVRALLDEAADLPLKVMHTVPSCVPAAPGFSDAGAEIDAADVARALEWPESVALGEMMDVPGVVAGDEAAHEKLAATYDAGLVAQGHFPAPETGAPLDAFVAAGVSSDHESVRREDALAKLRRGMWTMLRQGSAWHDIPETVEAVTETGADTRHLLLVADDIHPGTVREEGHLDRAARTAISNGLNPLDAIRAITLAPAEYYGVDADLGSLSPGKVADVVFLDDLAELSVERVMVDGDLVVRGGEWLDDAGLPSRSDHTTAVHDAFPDAMRDTVVGAPPRPGDFTVPAPEGGDGAVPERVEAETIVAKENRADTGRTTLTLPVEDGAVTVPDGTDAVRAFVFNRHAEAEEGDRRVGRGFVTGFGFDRGAVASTVAHDSHNLLVLGRDADDMARAAECLHETGGGMVAVGDGEVLAEVPLPVAGLMSDRPMAEVTDAVDDLHEAWRTLGCTLESPFMTMSLLALPVIPELRLTTRGLVDATTFEFVDPVRPA
jgi:adenine deaminase